MLLGLNNIFIHTNNISTTNCNNNNKNNNNNYTQSSSNNNNPNTNENSMDTQDANTLYQKILRPLILDSRPILSEKLAYHYLSQATGDLNFSRERTLRIAQEQASLINSLPLNVDSSVFVRYDEERLDVMQVLITGPPDTPYSAGCFHFDVFFPNNYPASPPKINLMTTGAGTVRFNPNLYNCGKVCLSLLGTWSGASGEMWNKDTSTFLQVLVSIQSLILVPMPYFNEPGYERQIGTPEGDLHNRRYNDTIRAATLKFAILSQLTHPTPTFADVISAHFYLKKQAVLTQCEEWLADAKSNKANYSAMLLTVREIKTQLEKLKPPVPDL
eukprot:TRINITY_DN1298_c0_g1_i2.p1 TRINITY_DN1298_c0_g1~~TRINITY_DN1298_c0_g1_i2.p1  ORF type:complete len:329 (-),score=64.07 TRINITY_DN1298_c0_g1_i2:28-1014(-)